MADRPELNEDFLDMLHAFVDAGVDFLVVGAHALAAHGVVRATGDLDILVRPTPVNADRVVTGLLACSTATFAPSMATCSALGR